MIMVITVIDGHYHFVISIHAIKFKDTQVKIQAIYE